MGVADLEQPVVQVLLSGGNGERPARVRRTTASSRSSSGTTSTAIGSSSGTGAAAGRQVPALSAAGSIWPVSEIVEAASSSPSSIEPESPMKIRPG